MNFRTKLALMSVALAAFSVQAAESTAVEAKTHMYTLTVKHNESHSSISYSIYAVEGSTEPAKLSVSQDDAYLVSTTTAEGIQVPRVGKYWSGFSLSIQPKQVLSNGNVVTAIDYNQRGSTGNLISSPSDLDILKVKSTLDLIPGGDAQIFAAGSDTELSLKMVY